VIVVMTAGVLTAAQGQTGSITGRVTDGGRGVLPGATVVVTNGELHRTAVSDAGGQFTLEKLPAGTYRLTATLTGFASARQDGVEVTAGRAVDASLSLRSALSRIELPPDGPDPIDPAVAATVNAVIFETIFRDRLPNKIVVQAESIVPPPFIDEDWTRELGGVPAELRAVVAAEADRRSVWHRAAAFPAGTQLIPRKQIDAVFERFGLEGWGRLRDRLGASSFQALTRVFVTEDGRHAVVEYRHSCGSLCGEGALVWLSRPAADSEARWTIRGRGFMWVS
jgi:hypothetical protein